MHPVYFVSLLETVWQRLQTLSYMEFETRSQTGSQQGWNGSGVARVTVEKESSEFVIRLHEQGVFTLQSTAGAAPRQQNIQNVFRYQLQADRLQLFHERFGRDHAVWLFDLVVSDPQTLICAQPHQCAADQYRGSLQLTDSALYLRWQIDGPRKNEELIYRYR